MKNVVVGLISKNDEILLIKHKRKNMWLPVGGHVERGETLIEALKREIKEELNIEVDVDTEPFYVMKEPNELTHHFNCIIKNGTMKIKKDEITDYKWFSKKDLEEEEIVNELKEIIDIFHEKVTFKSDIS